MPSLNTMHDSMRIDGRLLWPLPPGAEQPAILSSASATGGAVLRRSVAMPVRRRAMPARPFLQAVAMMCLPSAGRTPQRPRVSAAGERTAADDHPPNRRCGTVIVQMRRMGLGDLPYVVGEHLAHFPDGFFARLGPNFLTRYYRTFLDGPEASATVAELDGTVCAYLVGVLKPRRHRRLLLQHHGRSLALAGVRGLLAHPTLALVFAVTRLRRYSAALLRARSQRIETPESAGGTEAVLSHVAVSPPKQGAGIGGLLLNRFVEEARHAGCSRICLVTVAGTHGAGPYYEHRGWQRAGERVTPDGRTLALYQLALNGEGAV